MFCSKCGQQILDESKFCKYCGTNIASAPQTAKVASAATTAYQTNAGGNLCKVSVHRKKGFAGTVMSAKVICNGKGIGSVGNGETKDFQVASGSVLVFKCSMGPGTETDPITINTDGKIQLEWTNTAKAVLFGPLTMLSKKHRQQFAAKIVESF